MLGAARWLAVTSVSNAEQRPRFSLWKQVSLSIARHCCDAMPDRLQCSEVSRWNACSLALQLAVCMQDLLHCLFLAEGSYKIIDHEPQIATELTAGLMEGFSSDLICLQNISWSLPSVNHRQALAALCLLPTLSVMTANSSRIILSFTTCLLMIHAPWQCLWSTATALVLLHRL